MLQRVNAKSWCQCQSRHRDLKCAVWSEHRHCQSRPTSDVCNTLLIIDFISDFSVIHAFINSLLMIRVAVGTRWGCGDKQDSTFTESIVESTSRPERSASLKLSRTVQTDGRSDTRWPCCLEHRECPLHCSLLYSINPSYCYVQI